METLNLGNSPLTLENVRQVAVGGRRVELSIKARRKIEKAWKFLQTKIKSGDTFYGINTGFGLLSNVRIKDEGIETLQYNLLRSHACGVGPYLEDHFVRGMLLLRASNLALGHSGVSVQTVEGILALLNRGVCPLLPGAGHSACF